MSLRLNRVVIHLLAVAQLAFAQSAWSADIQAAGVVAAGTPAATPYFVCDSGAPGPSVVIIAGLHGDEPAGSLAADQIRNWPVKRGKVVVLPCANAAALKAGKRLTPGAEPDESNLNRNFPADASEAARGELASNLWAFVVRQRPDWLVDLHEGSDFNRQTNHSVGSSVIAGATPEARAAAEAMLAAVNASIANAARRFTLLRPPVAGSLARAAGECLGAHALIAETTTKGQPLSLRTRQHRILVHALLSGLGMLDASITPERMAPRGAEAGAAVRVAVYDDGGAGGVGGRRVEEQVRQQLGAYACRVCGDDIRGGALAWFRSEVAEHGVPPGVMSNSPAIVAGRYGKGRVLCSSPHPEQTAGLEAFIPRAVVWVSGR